MRLLLGLLVPSACSTALATPFPLTVNQTSGPVTFAAPPKRVVALGPHALDLLLSLGVQPVGYGEAAQLGLTSYGSPIRQIRYLGSRVTGTPMNVGNRFSPNLELVAALKPDLIVGEHYASASFSALNRTAPTLLFHGTSTGDWQKSIVVLGRVLGREAQAQRVIAGQRQRLAQARAALPATLRGTKALVVWNAGGQDRDVFTVLGPQDWTGGFFESLGFALSLPARPDPALGEGYQKLGSEGLVALKPDVVFVVASSKNTVTQARKDWQANALAQTLPASRNRQVYFLDIQLYGRLRGPIAEELMFRDLRRQLRP